MLQSSLSARPRSRRDTPSGVWQKTLPPAPAVPGRLVPLTDRTPVLEFVSKFADQLFGRAQSSQVLFGAGAGGSTGKILPLNPAEPCLVREIFCLRPGPMPMAHKHFTFLQRVVIVRGRCRAGLYGFRRGRVGGQRVGYTWQTRAASWPPARVLSDATDGQDMPSAGKNQGSSCPACAGRRGGAGLPGVADPVWRAGQPVRSVSANRVGTKPDLPVK